MGLFFKSEKRSLSSRSESMLDFITNADGSVTINFELKSYLVILQQASSSLWTKRIRILKN